MVAPLFVSLARACDPHPGLLPGTAPYSSRRAACRGLDVAPIVVGGSPAQSLRNSLDLAQHAERLGSSRYWVAEHHNLSGIASAATAVVIAHLAQGTQTMRVGAGGVMLPNHPHW